ncbi:MAG TPA: hypothetical protein VK913_12090 [Erythrobacter sp.]|nr:hypothetical protein [Erythrobacter sp.]
MLAIAIALLFTLIGAAAVLTIADSAVKARHAYARLMREAALIEAGFAVQVSAQELRMRRAPVRLTPDRRPVPSRLRQLPACAAA